MIVRAALVFVGVILAGVFLNLYFLGYAILGIFVLGIESENASRAAYWVCLILGSITAIALVRRMWPTTNPPAP